MSESPPQSGEEGPTQVTACARERLLTTWRSHLVEIRIELNGLVHLDDVFWQVQAILQHNPGLPASAFTFWIGSCYVAAITAGIRRLADRRKHVISLRRLLDDMERGAPQVLTREWYVQCHSQLPEPFASRLFDRLAQGTSFNHISRARIRAVQRGFEQSVTRLRSYAEDFVVHHGEGRPAASVSHNEARTALAVAHRTVNWCSAVLYAPVQPRAGITIQGDWLAIFREPWIPPGSRAPPFERIDDAVRRLDETDPL